MITDAQRILAVIEYSKMSRRALGIALGYADGAFLFHVINKRNGISTKLAKRITNLYPEINFDWLLKGTGEMIIEKEAESIRNLSEKIELLERYIKGQDARIELLEQRLASLSNKNQKD